MKPESKPGARNGAPGEPSLLVLSADSRTTTEIDMALSQLQLSALDHVAAPEEIDPDALEAGAIVAFVCDVDVAAEMAALRRLRRERRETPIVVISSPATGTGVRRALDAGADAVVFKPDIATTLAITVLAVASGQSVVPRKLRASVERPAFSHRERQVLALVSKGLTNSEIAERLLLAQSTIKSHLSSAFAKLGIRSRKEVTALLLDPEQAQSVGLAGLSGAAFDLNGADDYRLTPEPIA